MYPQKKLSTLTNKCVNDYKCHFNYVSQHTVLNYGMRVHYTNTSVPFKIQNKTQIPAHLHRKTRRAISHQSDHFCSINVNENNFFMHYC